MQQNPGRWKSAGVSFWMWGWLAMGLVLCGGWQARADTTEVLPKGIFNITVNPQFYLPVHHRFGPDGQVEELGQDFNGVLGSNVFPALGRLEAFLGLPPGSATIGRSVVSIEREFTLIDFYFSYGISDRLSFGVKIPYWFVKTNVDASLDATRATIGKNAALNTLLPLRFPGTVPLTTQDVKSLLGRGLDLNGDGLIDIGGFNYKQFESLEQQGFSDMEGGFKYKYLDTKDWKLAAFLGARFPTGELEDTDDLLDYGFGSGAWGLILAVYNDYTGIKDLVLDFTFRYKLLFSDSLTLRVPRSVNEPITANKEDVDRDVGDIFEFETSASYTFAQGWSVSALYKYGFSLKDEVSGRPGISFTSLEDETDYVEHVGIVGLNYSTIPLYQAKKFPVPLSAGITYRNRFAGENALKSQYIGLSLSVFF